MTRTERIREVVDAPPTPEQVKERAGGGWRLVAVEWERTTEPGEDERGRLAEDLPYGLRVAADCRHLEEEPREKQVLMLMMERLIQEYPFPQLAEELNRQGYRTREGARWNAITVFSLVPRLVEVGPQIFSSSEWVSRRQYLFKRLGESTAIR